MRRIRFLYADRVLENEIDKQNECFWIFLRHWTFALRNSQIAIMTAFAELGGEEKEKEEKEKDLRESERNPTRKQDYCWY